MGRTKKKRSNSLEEVHPDWIVSDEIQVHGRKVSKGTELSIISERGRFRFVKHVRTPTAEWIDVVGGMKGVSMSRSFRVEKIKTVHWKNRLRESQKPIEKLESS
jgi:hypothetical protein